MSVQLHIPFEPVPWTAPRLSRRRVYDPQSKHKKAVRDYIKSIYKSPMLQGYLSVHFRFAISPPKSASKKQRKRMLGHQEFPTKCDATNLQKLYEDCLKKIVYEDDRYNVFVSSSKIYAENPYINICIKPMYPDLEALCKS